MCVLRLLLLPAEYDNNGHVVWATGPAPPSTFNQNYSLVCQNDGNVVLYDRFNNVIWSTGTCCH
jgi:hypothetical protein